jgi:hypothetical protein
MRPNHLLPTLALALLLCCFGKLAAQPGWSPPPTPCDTLRPINLTWRTDTVTTQMVTQVVARLDSAVGAIPDLDRLWRTALRAMVLDSTAMRCPDDGFVSVDLPEVTHVVLDIHREGLLLQLNAYQSGKQVAHRYLSLLSQQAPAEAVWQEEILDYKTLAYIRRRSDFAGGTEAIVVITRHDNILRIDHYHNNQRAGLQYASRKGKDVFLYLEPGSLKARKLNLRRPEDQAIWQREGKAFYDEAFNFYFRLPEPLLEFGTPAARKMIYSSPFVE